MAKQPKVTIVILNHNGFKDTFFCLTTLLKTKYSNFHIIVVDNGSKDDESALLKKIFKNKRINFLRFKKNLGFTGGNNRILKTINTKYVVLLNNDVEVSLDWLSPLVKRMEKDDKIAVIQPKILWLTNKKYFDYAGACGGFIDIFGYPFTRGRMFNTIEKDKGQYDSLMRVLWASGAAMMIRKSVLDKIGLFDERFFNYMEEIDLCYRINKAGFKVFCEPKSLVYHKVGATASKNDLKKRFWEHRNNLLFTIKNFPSGKLAIIFIPRLFLEFVSIFYYLSIKRGDYALAVILSQFSLMYMAPAVLIKKITSRKGKTKLRGLIYPGSISFSYFILRKRKFSQIPKFI